MTGMPTLAVALEDVSGNFTIDITQYVKLSRSWTIRRGRNDEQSDVDAGRLTMQLDNFDGRFTLGSTFYSGGIYADKRIRVTETVGGVPRIRHTGFVQNWPTEWESPIGNVALCSITSMDRHSRLNRRKLRSTAAQEILDDAPAAYYTLGEAVGSLSAGDTSGNGRPSLSIVDAGVGGASPEFGATLNDWDGLTGCRFTAGRALAAPAIFTTPSTSLTIEAEASFSAASSKFIGGVLLEGSGFLLAVDSLGHVIVWQVTGDVITALVTSSASYNDGQLHVFAATVSGTTCTLYADGASVGSAACTAVSIGVAAELNVGFFRKLAPAPGSVWDSILASVAVFTTSLSAARLTAHANALRNGFNTERSDQRIARLASYAKIAPADQSLETGILDAVPAASTKDKSVYDAMKDVVTAEGGILFVAGDGKLTFHNRQHRALKSTQAAALALLAEDLVADDTKFDGSKDYLVNTAVGVRRSGAEQRVVNAPSVLKYEEYPSSDTDLLLATDQQVLDFLNWKVNAYNEIRARMSTLTLDLLTLPQATVQAALAVEIGDRITVTTFPTQAPVTTADLIVEGIVEEQRGGVDDPRWRITYNTVPAALFNAWILGDATYGVLGSTTRLHW